MEKLIIAGGRDFSDYEKFCKVVSTVISKMSSGEVEIVSGGAKGVDAMAIRYANENSIPVKVFEADWEADGKSAGYIRNATMGRYASRLLAIWDGRSKGTAHMIKFMNRANKPITIVRY